MSNLPNLTILARCGDGRKAGSRSWGNPLRRPHHGRRQHRRSIDRSTRASRRSARRCPNRADGGNPDGRERRRVVEAPAFESTRRACDGLRPDRQTSPSSCRAGHRFCRSPGASSDRPSRGPDHRTLCRSSPRRARPRERPSKGIDAQKQNERPRRVGCPRLGTVSHPALARGLRNFSPAWRPATCGARKAEGRARISSLPVKSIIRLYDRISVYY